MPISSPLPLSCYIRTFNEARKIDEVVRAALSVAQEVIIVDSNSTDATVTLAEAAGARVIVNAWPGDGYQKRVGEDACRHDWLLDIDGDEVITPKLAAHIRQLFASGEPDKPVYEMKMVHAPAVGEPWWDFNPSWRRKLYDRRRLRMPAHAIWDQLDIPKDIVIGRVDGVLLHYSFKDIAHVVAKYNSRSTTTARDGKRKSKTQLIIRIWLALPVYFLKQFILRELWRAGTYGLILALCSAYSRWLRDAKMYELIRMEEAAKSIKNP
jgi:glycosyltransferase involved in cell wall biosynthesis